MRPASEALNQDRWLGLWDRLGARNSGQAVFAHLAVCYAEPGRVYHTVEHIRDCLGQFDLARESAPGPDEVEAALWFHDAVYVPGASDNEDQSALLAEAALTTHGVPREVAGRIAGLVRATRHLTIPSDPDAQLTCDIDLSILGRGSDIFDQFERRIRQEYEWVPEPVYRTSRSEILEGFLRRPSIYQTAYFRNRYEAAARANLERLIAQLGAK
jgi:predicted metal-dependent HD superfamily phosphohydrolase